MEFCLKQIASDNFEPITIRLQQDEVEIGRQKFPCLRRYTQVSGRHALLKKINNEWFIKDLGSLNGVYVNGREIEQMKKLENGDVIGFGYGLSICKGFVCTFFLTFPEEQKSVDVLSDDEPTEDGIDVQTNSTVAELSTSLSDKISITNGEMSPSLNLPIPVENNPFYTYDPPNLEDDATCSESKTLINNNSFNISTNKLYSSALLSSNSAAQNSKSIESRINSTFVNVNQIPRMKLFSIPLVKCDSKYFHYPSDVKLPSQRKKKMHQRKNLVLESSDEDTSIHEIKTKKAFKKRKYVESSDEETDIKKIENEKIHKQKRTYIDSSDEDVNTQNKYFQPVLKRTNYDFELKSQSICHNSSNHLLSDSDTRVFVDIDPETVSTMHNNALKESNRTVETKNHFDSNDIFSKNSVSERFINLNTSQNSSNVAIVKPMLSETRNISDKNKTGEGIGYSQDEEVIYISDTETYLDFDSSQPIKQEPHSEDEESDLQLFNELPDENDVICDKDTNIYDESETGIQKFILEHGISNIKTEPPELRDEEVLNDAESLNISVQPFDMQATPKDPTILGNVESHDSEVTFQNVTHSIRLNKSDVQKNSCVSRSAGKTLLIEPKPMKHRSLKIRGKEEWFVPNEPLLKSENNLKLETSKKVTDISERKKKLQLLSPKKSSVQLKSKKSVPSVKKRPENFNSRSKFLTNLTEGKLDRKSNAKYKSLLIDRNKNKTLLPHTNSNSSVSLVQNEDVHSKPSISKDTQLAVSDVNQQENKIANLNDNTFVTSDLSCAEMSQQNAVLKFKKTDTATSSKVSRTIFPSLNTNSFDLNNVPTNSNFNICNEDFFSGPSTSKEVQVTVSNSPLLTNLFHGTSQRKTTNEFKKPNLQISQTYTLNHLNRNLFNLKTIPTNTSKPQAIVSSTNRNQESQAPDNVRISFNLMLVKILCLNSKWIKEQKIMGSPPPDVKSGVTNLPLEFSSHQSYVSHFAPMLMLEMWDEICKVAQPILEEKDQNKFYYSIESYENKSNLTEYICKSVINKNSPLPLEGTLVIIDIQTEKAENEHHTSVFGYINKLQKVSDFSEVNPLSSEVWRPLPKFWTDNAKLWELSIFAKRRENFPPALNCLKKGRVICPINHKLILADNLNNLQFSPLCKYILQPDKEVFPVKCIPNRSNFTSQETAIESISAELQKPCNKPKIILLQGPPGTGKTYVAITILQNLIKKNLSNLKILMLAPSKAAIDNIGDKLRNLSNWNKFKKRTPIKFVRVGLDHNKRNYSLEMRTHVACTELAKEKLKEKEEELCKVTLKDKKQPSLRNKKYIESLMNEIDDYKNEILGKIKNNAAHETIKNEILKESRVILSTFNGCNQSTLLSLFQSKAIEFSCCIVDEASQFTEPEILQPLTTYCINKLVLVGDHMQLPPTVSSQLALERHFDRSMFERFYLHFSKYKPPNPIYTLDEQFRMHSDICSFPSQYFYDCKLKTMPENDGNLLPLLPYTVCDICNQDASCMSLTSNCTKVIQRICSEIQPLINLDISVGIITPYEAQVNLYKTALSDYPDIEINTVDNFQGKEKDIIIISCVHSNDAYKDEGILSSKKILNVALTRACKSLIICVHANTLHQCKYWKDLIGNAKERHKFLLIRNPRHICRIFYETMYETNFQRMLPYY